MTKEEIHKPTLESIEMVEATIKQNSNQYSKFQLWQKLPRKMMYQTFSYIINYLQTQNKIKIENKKIIWTNKQEKLFIPPRTRKKMQNPVKLNEEQEKLVESLNPDERSILPYLNLGTLTRIIQETGLDETRVLRALQYLTNKNIIKLTSKEEKIIELDINGEIYLKQGLPERRLLEFVAKHREISLSEASQKSGLDDNEFKASLGALKRKAMIDLKNGKIILNAKPEEIKKKSLEEQFLEILPINVEQLKPEQKLALEKLKDRKNIIKIEDKKQVNIHLEEIGKHLVNADLEKYEDLIEQLTPEIIREESWKNKKFRRYDITSNVPEIAGGKRHFVNQAVDYAKKVWTELGFKEMSGTLCQTGFWNFDALFTAQDHPVREIQDTFYIKDVKGKLPSKEIVEAVKQAHEQGIGGSKGWGGKWTEKEAERVILRTHTTCLSAQTLTMLRKIKNKQGKFFSIGKCFRNETIDWSHGFEFNQTDGIVIDKNANFRNLLGYLKEFFKKMGFDDVKFVPSYFPYTEPSTEIYGFMKEKNKWIEIGGAGIFRPEVVIPLLGEYIPVLAWGPGFDRTLMDYYQIKDLRELYENNLTKSREKKFWMK